ncbi:cytokinin riboside 5'-monophosphate phosphoribohydrolase [Nocardioides phosphati]|uniref:Cytokinin riboside 5'-monophosphate phosphoribohydrolase n=1 Tax=Nocardioides phosphati TaxID=1867775 RepID=A0ABQ2ND68_9ACTN|nr:TIGR00730 family Rossman fold protein [Nocardioides phosphati]GGO91557.1 cytokinin riboside 5'-monophosphate phosphoribohydrolase [Nocardioides phosphati]
MLRRLALFLGSRDGSDPAYAEMAYDVGRGLAQRDIELVYGGGSGGLMGRVSQGVLDHGGRVYGVIPRFMVEREWARLHEERVEMHVVDTMHERKAMMSVEAEAFLVLPGGLGTLEELFEVWTWRTLGLHEKPIGLLNPDSFWDPLVAMLHRLAEEDFMDSQTVRDLVVEPTLEAVLAGLERQL